MPLKELIIRLALAVSTMTTVLASTLFGHTNPYSGGGTQDGHVPRNPVHIDVRPIATATWPVVVILALLAAPATAVIIWREEQQQTRKAP